MRAPLPLLIFLLMPACVPSGRYVHPLLVNTTDHPVSLTFQTNGSREQERLQVLLPPNGRFAHQAAIFVPTGETAPTADVATVGPEPQAVHILFSVNAAYEIKLVDGVLSFSLTSKEGKP